MSETGAANETASNTRVKAVETTFTIVETLKEMGVDA